MPDITFFSFGLQLQTAALAYSGVGAALALCHGVGIALILSSWKWVFLGGLGVLVFLLAGAAVYFEVSSAVRMMSAFAVDVYPIACVIAAAGMLAVILYEPCVVDDTKVAKNMPRPDITGICKQLGATANMWGTVALTIGAALCCAVFATILHTAATKDNDY